MKTMIFDIEVFKHDWVAVFKERGQERYEVFHNDGQGLEAILASSTLVGFNNKWYDNHILAAILIGADNFIIKDINDFMIEGNPGWEHPYFKSGFKPHFTNYDVRDDMQRGLSLKAVEGHLSEPIIESSVDFNINRPLTRQEVLETIEYSKYDVQKTEKILDLRDDYIQGKLSLARMKGIDQTQALACTNARLAAMFLDARPTRRNDERHYQFPDNLKQEYIPEEVLNFFGQTEDKRIPSRVLFKSKLVTNIGGCETKFGFGGVHGSLQTYYEEATDTRVILNKDVASMYPSLMIQYGYASRNIPSFDSYKKVFEQRMYAKKTGDREVDQTLKLVLNSTFGAMGARTNALYDPLQFRSVTITGQLLLTSLAVELDKKCTSLKLLNLNTDGAMFSVDKTELAQVESICKAWETNSRMILETDDIKRVWIKDVNSLLFETIDGKIQRVGGLLNHGISVKGAWNINNNFTIVKDAVVDYFIHDTPVEETINKCDDIFRFQIIAKATNLYSGVFQMIMGEKVAAQRCNRVYATTKLGYGTLYKTHSLTKRDEKIGGLPDSCIIDNKNLLTIDEIDKNWYIQLAEKYINDFKGVQTKRINRRTLNALQRRGLRELDDPQTNFFLT